MTNIYTERLDRLFGGLRPTIEPQSDPEPTMAERLLGHDPEILEAVMRYQDQADAEARLRQEKAEAMEIINLITEAMPGITADEIRRRLENSPEENRAFQRLILDESPLYANPRQEAEARQAAHNAQWDAAEHNARVLSAEQAAKDHR